MNADQFSMFDPAPPHQAHSQTSRDAATAIEPELPRLQAKVLDCLKLFSKRGLTDEQMQRMLRMNPSTQRPRRCELLEKGLIEDTGTTRKTISGRNATVWRAK